MRPTFMALATFVTALTLLMCSTTSWAADETPKEGDPAIPTKELIERLNKQMDGLIGDIAGESKKLLTSEDQHAGFPEIVVWASARQWTWSFKHHDLRDPSGKAHLLPASATAPNDSLPLNALVFPQGAIAHIHITSDDIIHPFKIPTLGINKEAVPGRLEQININTSQTGVFISECGVLCGKNKDDMVFTVHVVDAKTFANWRARLKAQAR